MNNIIWFFTGVLVGMVLDVSIDVFGQYIMPITIVCMICIGIPAIIGSWIFSIIMMKEAITK